MRSTFNPTMNILHIAALAVTVTLGASLAADEPKLQTIPIKDIDGKATSLKAYAGQVVLAVNVASQCGSTPQYAGLQSLYERLKDKGLVVVGFPSNDFGAQEPGTNADIKSFCASNYSVTFPMMEKMHVKGPGQHPLFKALTGPGSAIPGDIQWNFGKILIGRDGKVLARFESDAEPDDSQLVKAIEDALAKK